MDDAGNLCTWERSSRIGKNPFRQEKQVPDDPACSLKQLSAKGSLRKAGDEFVAEVKIEGASAKS